MEAPEVRYARSGDVRVAYQIFGTGPVDLVYGRTAISHLELVWEEESISSFFRELGSVARVILWDKRGVGLSDRTVGTPTLEDRMDDVRAVMDAAGSQRSVIFGSTDTAAMALLFAATYPERTLGLILMQPTVRGSWSPDYPYAPTREEVEKSIRLSDEDWGSAAHIDRLIADFIPSRSADPEFKRWFGRVVRFGSSPSAAAKLVRMNLEIDVRSVLAAVHVPTMILKCPGDRSEPEENSDYVAAHVAGSQLITIPGKDHFFWASPEAKAVSLHAQKEFLTHLPGDLADEDRMLKTVIFADIVGSTALASRLGDHAWRELLDSFLAGCKAEAARFRGHFVKATGDGFLATFEGPTRAVRFAQRVREQGARRGLELRAGIHTGECLVNKDDVVGIAVHLASRICDSAGSAEVVTSRTVRDLAVGSEVRFEPRGAREFKGVTGTWETFLVVS